MTKISPKNVNQPHPAQQQVEMPQQTKYSPIRKDLGIKPAGPTNLVQA